MQIKTVRYINVDELFESEKELEDFLVRVDGNVSYGDANLTLLDKETMLALAKRYNFGELETKLNSLSDTVQVNFESRI